MTLKNEILALLRRNPGLTDREITNRLRGATSPQQPVNIACRELVDACRLQRQRSRTSDNYIGNYVLDDTKLDKVLRDTRKLAHKRKMSSALPTLTESILVDGGFHHAGNWERSEKGIRFRGTVEQGPIVYAFVVEGEAKYVGKSSKDPHRRFYTYANPGSSQKTNIRISPKIREMLIAGKEVKVYIAAPGRTDWNGFPVQIAEGLESGILSTFHVPWNILK